MNPLSINETFSQAVLDYQDSKDEPKGIVYNSFLTVVIRSLICIYSELDIINPIMTESADALKENLAKFGYSRVDIEEFFHNLELFANYEKEKQKQGIFKKNPYFEVIEKQLVDMLICKKMNFHLTEKEVKEFYELLYTPYTPDPLRISFNFANSENVLAIDEYFKKQMKENIKIIEPKEKNILNLKAYEILNYSLDNIKAMSSEEIDKVNHQVYDYFKIRENAINKEYLLEKAIDEYFKEKNKVTTGNGYVDILLIMSVICTTVMLISVVAFLIL